MSRHLSQALRNEEKGGTTFETNGHLDMGMVRVLEVGEGNSCPGLDTSSVL